jgi:hypothetical protein
MSAPAHAVSIERIKDGLAARAHELCRELLPAGRRAGHEYFVGGVDGAPGDSMAINLAQRAGVWMDFATGEGGDAIDLVAAVLFRGCKRSALAWARSWLGLDGLDPNRLKITRQAVQEKHRQDESALTDAERSERAARLYTGAKAWNGRDGIMGTPVETYLIGRGIALRTLGRRPGALAYSRQVWNPEKRAQLPAMLAAVQRRARIVAVHRTFLAIQPDGRVTKAAVVNPKLSLGPVLGGVIPLARGDSRTRWADLWDAALNVDWQPTEADRSVTLTEGIEDALSIAMADPSRRVVACISLANMGSADLPPCLTDVTIAADNDRPGSLAARHGLPRVVEALQKQGRTVRIARPPAGHKDFNAWLQALVAPSQGAAA